MDSEVAITGKRRRRDADEENEGATPKRYKRETRFSTPPVSTPRASTPVMDPECEVAAAPLLDAAFSEPVFAVTKLANGAEDPVFGTLLVDYGYKQLYDSSAKQLKNRIGIWQQQRPADRKRVKEIAETKKASLSFPGVISIFRFDVEHTSIDIPQITAVFDGQHRMLAIKQILDEAPNKDFRVTVEVYPVQRMQQVVDLYVEINKSEPVQEIDLPDTIESNRKQLIDKATEFLYQKYKPMFSDSSRCKVPHVYLAAMRNNLFKHGVIEKHRIQTEAELIDLLEDKNKDLEAKPDRTWPENVQKHLTKARKFHFFLGMTHSWWEQI